MLNLTEIVNPNITMPEIMLLQSGTKSTCGDDLNCFVAMPFSLIYLDLFIILLFNLPGHAFDSFADQCSS